MTTLGGTSRPSAFAVFRRRHFTLLWIAQFISTMGGGLTSIAASILVFRLTGSAMSVGLMLIATALPSLFIGLIAGVFVDRFDRKKIMIASDLIRAVLIALIPVLLPFGITWLYVIVLLSSAVGQFFDPAQSSVLPEVASDEELAAANSMMTISSVGALTVGFAGAGVIATLSSVAWAFYLDAASYVVSALCIMLMHVAPLPPEEETTVAAVVRNLRAGMGFVRNDAALRSLFLVFVPICIAFGLNNVLLLPFATRALGATEFEYSLLEGVFTVGFVVGSLLMARLADRLHEGQWVALSIIGMAVGTVLLAVTPSVALAIALNSVIGILNAPSYIGRSLLIQRNSPREMRGRISSAFLVTRNTAFILGMAAAGLADWFDVRWLLLIVGLAMLGSGVLALLLPGIGQPAAEWRRMLAMLRSAPAAPGLGLGRAAMLTDIDTLALRLPVLAGLSHAEREELARDTRVFDALAGTAVVRQGERSDAAYVLLNGRTVASRTEDGATRVLEVHNAGDFFGEIAALTGVPRTADVVAEVPTTLLQIPPPTLRRMMNDTHMNRLFLTKMTERMVRMQMIELPRFAALDQAALRELRTPEPALALDTPNA